MSSVRENIQSCYPTIDEMPFCAALREGRFGREEILRSEIVELLRAVDTRGRIQEMYKEKLREAEGKGIISRDDLALMVDVIDDEGETEDHIDHIDMRYKLFAGTELNQQSKLKMDPNVQAINDEWMSICQEGSLFALMAVTAAIEDWYAPLSGFFEVEYRKRGFGDEELELFIVHKGADVDHSNAQFDILERIAGDYDEVELKAIVTRTFMTSKNYDAAKLRFAELDCSLGELIG